MSKKTISAGGFVINDSGEVLVVNQRGNSWSLPKGHVDPGEDLLTAAMREIHEEAGVLPDNLSLVEDLGSYERARIGKHGGEDTSEVKTLHFFLFRTSQVDLCPIDDDNPEARWVQPSEVAELLTHPKDKLFFSSKLGRVKQKSGE